MKPDEIKGTLKELLWRELAQFESKTIGGGHQFELCEFLRNFTIKHRLCVADVEEAIESLAEESRIFPDGRLFMRGPDRTEIPMGELYENLRNTGALGCSNSATVP